MGLAILALFLLAWAVVLGGPMLGRFLRSRQDRGDDPLRDPFAALGRSVGRSVPRVDVPIEPRVVSVAGRDAPVPAELRRRRAVVILVAVAAVLLLLAIATGSIAIWLLQLLVDALFVAYTVALVRQARPRPARSRDEIPGPESIRELLLRSRRFVVPAVAVVALGAIVFGGVVIAGSGDDDSNDRAGAAVEGATGSDTATSATVRTPRTTTGVTLAEAQAAPPTTAPPVTVPASSRAAAPPATQPPNLFCVLLNAFC